jgi:hypothetical protein
MSENDRKKFSTGLCSFPCGIVPFDANILPYSSFSAYLNLLLSKKVRKFVPPSFKWELALYELFFIFIRRVVLTFSSNSIVGSRTRISTSLTCFVASLLFVAALPLQSQSRLTAPLKINLKPKTVTFVGGQGENIDCSGAGMCKGMMLRENESLNSYMKSDRALAAEGRFTMQDGKLYFILTNLTSKSNVSLADIKSLPIDFDTELPREIANGLGFSNVRVFKSRYAATAQGMFEVQAKLSVGLAATPAPKAAAHGERHASVSFEVLRQMNVSVIVLDANGKKVATLMENTTLEGSETPQMLSWNGMNDAGKRVASGEYRVEVRCVLTDSGASFAESVPVILAPVAIAH